MWLKLPDNKTINTDNVLSIEKEEDKDGFYIKFRSPTGFIAHIEFFQHKEDRNETYDKIISLLKSTFLYNVKV